MTDEKSTVIGISPDLVALDILRKMSEDFRADKRVRLKSAGCVLLVVCEML